MLATAGLLKTDRELDNLTGIGTGVMLFANLPIMLLLGHQAMIAYKDYIQRLRRWPHGPGSRAAQPRRPDQRARRQLVRLNHALVKVFRAKCRSC